MPRLDPLRIHATGPRSRAAAGFSLVEIVLVVLLLGLVASLALPRVGEAVTRRRVDLAAHRVAADLARVADLADYASNGKAVAFDLADARYTIATDAPLNNGEGDGVVDLGDDPYRVAIVHADFGGDATVRFNGLGEPDTGGRVTLRAGVFEAEVLLDAATGEVTTP